MTVLNTLVKFSRAAELRKACIFRCAEAAGILMHIDERTFMNQKRQSKERQEKRIFIESALILGHVLGVFALILFIARPDEMLGKSGMHLWKMMFSRLPLIIFAAGALLTGSYCIATRRLKPMGFLIAAVGIGLVFMGQRTMNARDWLFSGGLLTGGIILFIAGSGRWAVSYKTERMSRKYLLALVLAITAAGGFLRFYGLDEYPPGEFFDETLNMEFMLEFHTGKPFQITVAAKEFLFYQLGNGWMYLFGEKLIGLRHMVALLGTLTIPFVFLLGNSLFGPAAGIFSAVLLAVSPWHTSISRIVIRQNLAILFLAACYLMWRYTLKKNKILLYLASGLITGLGFHTWVTFKVAPVIIAAMILIRFITVRKNRWKIVVGSLLSAVLFFAVLYGPFLLKIQEMRVAKYIIRGEINAGKAAQNIEQVASNFKVIVSTLFGRPLNGNFYKPLFGLEPPFAVVFILCGTVLLLLSVRRMPELITLIMMIVHLMPAVLSDYPYQRRVQGLIIPFCLAGGLALSRWMKTVKNGKKYMIIAGIAAFVMLARGLTLTRQVLPENPYDTDDLYARIKNTPPSESIYLENEMFSRNWNCIMSYQKTGDRYAHYWGKLPESFPLYIRDDKDVSIFFRNMRGEVIIEKLKETYPTVVLWSTENALGQTNGWEAHVDRTALKKARQGSLDITGWSLGKPLQHDEKSYLPLDLSDYAFRWEDVNVWGWNLDAEYYMDNGNLRLNDLASGIMLIENIPLYLLPGSAVAMSSLLSPDKENLIDSFTVELPQPWEIQRIHILGMISPWLRKDVVVSARMLITRFDDTVLEIPLFARTWKIMLRDKRTPPYPAILAFQNRDTYMDLASIPVVNEAPVKKIEVVDVDPHESLLFAAVTLEGRPAEDLNTAD